MASGFAFVGDEVGDRGSSVISVRRPVRSCEALATRYVEGVRSGDGTRQREVIGAACADVVEVTFFE